MKQVIYLESRDIITNEQGKQYVVARDYDTGKSVWVYTSEYSAEYILQGNKDGEALLLCEGIVKVNDQNVEFNGFQFIQK